MEIREQLQRTLGTAYVLERELGGGGMSQVFVAEETAIPIFNRRLGELYEAKGNRVKAAEHYRKVMDVWKNADPELQVVVNELRGRVRRLSDNEGIPR